MTRRAAAAASAAPAGGTAGPALPEPTPTGRHSARGFVATLLLACLAAVAAVAAINWWLDPIGLTGRNTRFTSTQNGVVRTAKLDLMDALKTPPDVLILGSSRSMKLDPVVVDEVSGRSAFNAGVSGARTKDAYLFAAYADKLWPKRFPHLVVGVTNDMFHESSDERSLDRRLTPLIPKDLAGSGGASLYSTMTQLASLSTTKASLRTARIVVPAQGWDTLLHPEGRTGVEALRGSSTQTGREESLRRGMQVFDPGTARFNALDTRSRVELQMAEFIKGSFRGDPDFTGVDEQGSDYFAELVRLANERGDVPAVWITPYHPRARELLPPEYDERDRNFRHELHRLRTREHLKFRLFDYEDPHAFGGVDDEWFDGIHMQEPNTRRVVEQLHEDGAL